MTKTQKQKYLQAVNLVFERELPFSYHVLTVEQAIEVCRQEADGTAYATGQWRQFAIDETGINTGLKKHAFSNPKCVVEIKRRVEAFLGGLDILSPTTASLKKELLPDGKFTRLFFPVGLDNLVLQRMFFHNLISDHQENESWIAYHLRDKPAFMSRRISLMDELPFKYHSDATGADSTESWESLGPIYNKIAELQTYPDEKWDYASAYKRLVKRLVFFKLHMPDGTLWEVEGNSSGLLPTIFINSVLFYVLLIFTYLLLNLNMKHFDAMVRGFSTGDDLLVSSVSERILAFIPVAADILGLLIVDYHISKEISNHEFCGQKFIKREGYWVPTIEADAVIPALFWVKDDDIDFCSGIVQSLLINSWWTDDLRSHLKQYRNYLISNGSSFTFASDYQIQQLKNPAAVSTCDPF